MSAGAWWLLVAALVLAAAAIWWRDRSWTGEVIDLVADRDEDRDQLANLTADMAEQKVLLQQTRERLVQLANHVVGNEPPSSGRHAPRAALDER